MALGRAFSVAVLGLDGDIVEIEADITSGLPGVHLVGLPDAALQESRDRVRAAITNCNNRWPMSRLTLALSPATLPKMGSVYDLALAAAVLSAQRKTPWRQLEAVVVLGELALDGRVRPVRGVLPAVLAAKGEGWKAAVVPVENLPEASLVDGIEVWGVRTLAQLQAWLSGSAQLDERISGVVPEAEPSADLADVVGQTQARFAVEVAAAGAHHLMLTGPPGVGQNDAGTTSSGAAAVTIGRRVVGGHRYSLGGRPAVGRHAADYPAAVRCAASQLQRCGVGRRRIGNGAARRRQPGASRGAVPRRMRRDQCERFGGVANAVGGRRDSPCPPRWGGVLSGSFSTGYGR